MTIEINLYGSWCLKYEICTCEVLFMISIKDEFISFFIFKEVLLEIKILSIIHGLVMLYKFYLGINTY